MYILAIVSGEYGHRHVRNLTAHAPSSWSIDTWLAPAVLPPIVDYPEDYLPASFAPADLILSFAEHKGVAELLPDIARLSGAHAVIASIDSEAWLPRGLAAQLRGWLAAQNVVCVTPKPLCTLTPTHYSLTRRQQVPYDHPLIAEFARYFGQPELRLTIDPETRTVATAALDRDAACGCARYVAERLVGVAVDEAEYQAGMLHHHYPCLASMGIDADFGDTLMHVSGNLLRDNVGAQVRPFKRDTVIVPGTLSPQQDA